MGVVCCLTHSFHLVRQNVCNIVAGYDNGVAPARDDGSAECGFRLCYRRHFDHSWAANLGEDEVKSWAGV